MIELRGTGFGRSVPKSLLAPVPLTFTYKPVCPLSDPFVSDASQ